MKKSFWTGVVLGLTLVFQGGQTLAAASVEQLRALGARVVTDPKTSVTRFIGFDTQAVAGRSALAGQPANAALQQMPAEVAAAQHLSNHAAHFGLRDAASETRTIKHRMDDGGRTMTRYQQHYQGVPVIAGELIVNQTALRQLTSIGGKISPQLKLDTTPVITVAQAQTIARTAMAKWYQLPEDEFAVPEPRLSIYDSRLMSRHADPVALVWRMDVPTKGLRPINEFILVDAKTGIIPLHFNQVPHAKNRLTYDANNTTALPGTLVCNESNPACSGGIADAVSAHVYAGKTYDFYLTNFGRDGIDGAGMTMISTVRHCERGQTCPYANAFWNGTQMAYGQGFPNAEDIVAHELTHGVTERESNLFYYYQAGAMNESFSDVFGEFVQQSDPSGTVTPASRWLIGEDLNTGAIRSMKNPPLYSDPDKMTSGLYNLTASDNGGVHTNGGIGNKAAYLMVDGDTFNGKTVVGLGLTKVAKIYYEVNANLLTSGSDYLDLYNALYQACQNLVGAAGIVASDCQQVRNATDAVEMNLEPVAGFNTSAAQCPAGQTVSSTLFSDNLESPTANWLMSHTLGTSNWSRTTGYAASGLYSLYGSDPATTSDLTASMASGITLPAGAYLWFNHAFGFENSSGNNWDGGVLEYSTNGGSTWLDAGGLFSAGKNYGGTLDPGNPLGARSAFVADSHGYVASRYTLATLAGQTVRFRWRVGADRFVGSPGWRVDDVQVYTCVSSATLPSAPIIDAVTAGNASISVAFTPGAPGSGTLINYTADCGGVTNAGVSSPITVPGLTPGTSYTCMVKTTTTVGASIWSAPSNAVIPAPATTPAAPTAVLANAGGGSITVKFGAPASDGGAAITGYVAACTSPNGGVSGSNSGGAGAASIQVGGLTNGKSYTCSVTASNSAGAGQASAASSSVMPFDITPILYLLLDD